MTVLCLHGAYSNADKFQIQLQPFTSAVEKGGDIAFKWISARHTASPPVGFEDYFGPPPLYRFMAYDGMSALDDVLTKIREIPQGDSAEDTMRKLISEHVPFTPDDIQATMDELLKIIDDDPEIDGILGYSEGATVAASLILEEARRAQADGRERRIKYGIFFAGWPPIHLEDGKKVKTLLADECDVMIDIPTCHIVGCNDPYVHGAMALYSMCDEDTAVLFDHGKGHTVPRDPQTIEELTGAIGTTWERRTSVAV